MMKVDVTELAKFTQNVKVDPQREILEFEKFLSSMLEFDA